MISKIIFILSCIIYVTFCTEVCTNKSPCKYVLAANEVIDISAVGLVDFPRFYQINGGEKETHLYSYNPCYSFNSPDRDHTIQKSGNKPCLDAAACVRSPGESSGGLPEEHVIGVQSDAKFGSVQDNGTINFHINYTVPGVKGILMVKLQCTKEAKDHTLVVETQATETSDLTVMLLDSKCACPNLCASTNPDPPQEGMSTGSKLLIAFFTIFLAYFIIGLGWNFCNGAHGLELVPNYEFWNDLPKLIIDGVAFTCSCFSSKAAYGEV